MLRGPLNIFYSGISIADTLALSGNNFPDCADDAFRGQAECFHQFIGTSRFPESVLRTDEFNGNGSTACQHFGDS